MYETNDEVILYNDWQTEEHPIGKYKVDTIIKIGDTFMLDEDDAHCYIRATFTALEDTFKTLKGQQITWNKKYDIDKIKPLSNDEIDEEMLDRLDTFLSVDGVELF
jgi:hypothetical protein